MIRNLVLSAAAAGLAAGLLTAALQHVTTTPLILEAERYEAGAVPHTHGSQPGVGVADHHEPAAAEEHGASGSLRRTVQTSLATTVLGVGFALVLLGAMTLTRGRIDARRGLAFGVAGYAAVVLAPALGLPPEIPGAAGAELSARQGWWFLTVAATAAGLAAILLKDQPLWRAAGVVVIALPHIVGAPRPAAFASTAPAELAAHFAAASLVVTALFWAVLGATSGAVYERLARSA